MKLLSKHQSLFKSSFYLSNYQSNFGAAHKIGTKPTESYRMTNPLIAMIGISEYDNGIFGNLECVINDYKNVQHAFYVVRGYSIVYFNEKNQLRHRRCLKNTKMKMNRNVFSRNDLKLRWTDDEVLNYNKQVHKILENKKYSYDGLIYFVSCHGDRDSVIYDSTGNKIPLIVIFDKFNNQNCIQLRNKPKIYFVEACRGNQRTKRFNNSMFDTVSSIVDHKHKNGQKKYTCDTAVPDIGKSTGVAYGAFDQVHEEKNKDNISTLQVAATTDSHTPNPHPLDHNYNQASFTNLTTIDENDDKDDFKDVSIKIENENASQSSLNAVFSKYNYNREIYANTEGYAVVEPGSIGAYMTRSITQAIENDNIFKKDFDTIINHTRKIMLKLMGTSVECAAQVIEDNNNIPRKVYFG